MIFAEIWEQFGWKSEKFLSQMHDILTIAEIKYPASSYSIVFLFDQSSGHTAYADDALNANRMNVNTGWKSA